MRFALLFAAGALTAGCSGGGRPDHPAPSESRAKDATLACWRSFIDIGRSAEGKLGKRPTGVQVAAAYTEMANAIDCLPVLDVDPELTGVLSSFSRDFREVGAVYGRLSVRREDLGHGLSKIGESFLRGFAGDPFGTFREETAADRADKAALDRVKARLRTDVADLSALRARLTARYRVEFPPVG